MKYVLILISLLSISLVHATNTHKINVFEVARNGDLAQLKQYMQAGGSLNVANHKGHTPFILATYYNHQNITAWLLENKADACALDSAGNNAFMGVAFKGHTAMATWLLEHTGCSINHRNFAGQTALMMAALFDQEALVALFIEHGADVSIRDGRGNSAESLAAGQGLGKIVDIVRFSLANR